VPASAAGKLDALKRAGFSSCLAGNPPIAVPLVSPTRYRLDQLGIARLWVDCAGARRRGESAVSRGAQLQLGPGNRAAAAREMQLPAHQDGRWQPRGQRALKS
jgi:hypothetical protein